MGLDITFYKKGSNAQMRCFRSTWELLRHLVYMKNRAYREMHPKGKFRHTEESVNGYRKKHGIIRAELFDVLAAAADQCLGRDTPRCTRTTGFIIP